MLTLLIEVAPAAERRNRRASARRDGEQDFGSADGQSDEARHGKAFEGLLKRYFGK